MNISSAFPTKYLKCDDLQGREVKVEIDRVVLDEVEEGKQKPILYFRGKQKGLALNKTNAMKISSAYGDDTDSWEGRQLLLYPDTTSFQGKMVDCIRVRVPAAPADDSEAPF